MGTMNNRLLHYYFTTTLLPATQRYITTEAKPLPHFRVGGGKRDRTADLLHAMQALSQLSYTPAVLKCEHYSGRTCITQIAK